jgi:3-oxoacyl-[acyl-carrier protein] reductase
MMNEFFSLKNRVAIVTGGGQSIGEGICKRFAAAGARVAALDVNADNAKSVASQIGGVGVGCDVTNGSSVSKALAEARKALGPIDIVVNCAGIVGKTAPLVELDEENLDQVYAVNLKGVFLMCRFTIEEMLERKYGRIVNIASIAGKEGNPTLIPYSATKAGVIALTKALAKEVAGKGDITVNSIAPAVVYTKIHDTMPKATIDYMVSKIPMGRTGKIEEVAALVHYLVSSEASFTTGQCYDISGGRATY